MSRSLSFCALLPILRPCNTRLSDHRNVHLNVQQNRRHSASCNPNPYNFRCQQVIEHNDTSALNTAASQSITSNDTSPGTSYLHTSTVDLSLLSPMMLHYVHTKQSHPSHLLLYRVGDFYEAFFEDAQTLSEVCDIALTSKDGGKALAARVPMSGVPHHALQGKLRPLLEAGISIAIAEQLTPVRPGYALVERRVTRVLTPGTLSDVDLLPPRVATFLVAIHATKNWKFISAAIADVSTGDFRAGSIRDLPALRDLLTREQPAEIVVSAPDDVLDTIRNTSRVPLRLRDASYSKGKTNAAADLLREYVYSVDTSMRLEGVRPLQEDDGVLELDTACVRNMEIVQSMRGGDPRRSLCFAVDRTVTSMGARRVRALLLEPLRVLEQIKARHSMVAALLEHTHERAQLRALLKPIVDIERLAGRVASERASPREVRALALSLTQLPRIAEIANATLNANNGSASALINALRPSSTALDIAIEAVRALVDPAPASLAPEAVLADAVAALSGNNAATIFTEGYNAELDELRARSEKPSMWTGDFERDEQLRSGWPQLRVKHVKRLGFVLRIPRSLAERALDDNPRVFSRLGYERVHSTKAELRFRSDELASLEHAHHSAVASVLRRELALFCNLRSRFGEHVANMRAAASALALLDVLAGFAEVAAERGYAQPEMRASGERVLDVVDCRHAVVEQLLPSHRSYVPNSLSIGDVADEIILTGPNAAGKSCSIRSVGLCVIMAQAGCFVPARSAVISVCDRVLTRVGAVDDVADAMSSFQVEMAETAAILSSATEHSLVLLDEIGRGTGVVDGMGIACAVAEALARGKEGRNPAKTLFVTHYHELNVLAEANDNIAAMAMELVIDDADRPVATHRVVPGVGQGSLGVEVARKAGFPTDVVQRAVVVSSALRLPARALGRALLAEFEMEAEEEICADVEVVKTGEKEAYERGYRDGLEAISKSVHKLMENR